MRSPFAGLDLLSTATLLLDEQRVIRYANPAAENLFATSQRQLVGQTVSKRLGTTDELDRALANALQNRWSYTSHNLVAPPTQAGGPAWHLDCTVTPIEIDELRLLLECRPIDQQLKVAREELAAQQQQASRELIRNLAHEIRNPLGGIRGSAQLLAHELGRLDQDASHGASHGASLSEYTQVIIDETDRLQDLMQRLLSSHRTLQPTTVNVHEVLERVRRLILAEFGQAGIEVQRDYDVSLPALIGDPELLIQALLNIARNAAQALETAPESEKAEEGKQIRFCTRVARQVTLAKRRYRLAVEIRIIDNGPGIPPAIRDQIFYPLVSGRSEGSGLGLSLTQNFVHQHHGDIEVDSRPGYTCFRLLLPLEAPPLTQGTP